MGVLFSGRVENKANDESRDAYDDYHHSCEQRLPSSHEQWLRLRLLQAFIVLSFASFYLIPYFPWHMLKFERVWHTITIRRIILCKALQQNRGYSLYSASNDLHQVRIFMNNFFQSLRNVLVNLE